MKWIFNQFKKKREFLDNKSYEKERERITQETSYWLYGYTQNQSWSDVTAGQHIAARIEEIAVKQFKKAHYQHVLYELNTIDLPEKNYWRSNLGQEKEENIRKHAANIIVDCVNATRLAVKTATDCIIKGLAT